LGGREKPKGMLQSWRTSWLATFFAIALVIRMADAMPLTPIERITEKAANSVRLTGDSWADCGANNAIPPLLPMRSFSSCNLETLFTQRTGNAIFRPPPTGGRFTAPFTLHCLFNTAHLASAPRFASTSHPAFAFLWCHNTQAMERLSFW